MPGTWSRALFTTEHATKVFFFAPFLQKARFPVVIHPTIYFNIFYLFIEWCKGSGVIYDFHGVFHGSLIDQLHFEIGVYHFNSLMDCISSTKDQ